LAEKSLEEALRGKKLGPERKKRRLEAQRREPWLETYSKKQKGDRGKKNASKGKPIGPNGKPGREYFVVGQPKKENLRGEKQKKK